jgi:hypothetical protein
MSQHQGQLFAAGTWAFAVSREIDRVVASMADVREG